jgi:Tfp pilus assembly protein PilN
MIRVNLAGTSRKKAGRAGAKIVPQSVLPVLLLLIIAGAAVGGYWWYSDTSTRLATLNDTIAQAEAQRQALEAVIQQDQIYEARKAALESRIKIIEGLQRNQITPVVSLDFLAQAVAQTQYVWLSSLDQNNTLFSMSGIGTSVNAIADFVTNLENTRYFRNINLVNAQDSQGNFTFIMTCEFSPPFMETPEAAPIAPASPAAGGN